MSDRDRYAFSDTGPWTLGDGPLPWQRDLEALRERTRQEVPVLVGRRWLPPLGRFVEAGVGTGFAVLRWWLGARRVGGPVSRGDLSRRLRVVFERLGPTYIKLGQIVSSGKGLFPDELVEEFKRCRDQVPPEPFERVRAVVEADLGAPLEAIFARFEPQCLASASIAQVHAAVLASGERVVVKVQRSRVASLVRRDVAAMAWIAPFLVGRLPVAALANPPALVELFAETITEELDFRLEAQNMLDVGRVLRAAGQHAVVVPRPHPELVTRRVLVMQRLEGFGYEDVEGMRRAEIDTAGVLRALLISFLEGAMIYGVFHGDLHGGNLFVLPEGHVALLDFGITGRMEEPQRLAFLRMMMTGAVNDMRGQLEAFRDLGALPPDADLDELARVLRLDRPTLDPTRLSGEQLVAEIQDVLKGLLAHGAKLPKHLMLYVKNLLFLDSAVATLAPDLDLFAEIGRIYGYFVANHAEQILRDVGLDPRGTSVDLDGFRRGLGVQDDVQAMTHRELQERRRQVNDKVQRQIQEGGGPRV
jgi:ubiquinone biosynthesis protein